MSLINYQGDSKIIKRICQLLKVTDVQDGEGHSLVDSDGIAVVTGGGGGSSTLAGLSDVDTTGASAGDVLAYNGTSQKWEDKTLANVAASGSYNDLSNKPTALSSFTNDQGFITSSVNNLTNYYLKSETYTKTEVNTLIGQISTISILVVQSLPTTDIQTNIIYLVPKSTAGTSNAYDEYINTNGTSAGWELIGDTEVDLSNYYTKSEVNALIPDELADLTDDSTHRLVTDSEKTAWSAKIDDNPTFSEASTRANIASGESFATILGKIKKFFTDLATVAFSGNYNDLTNQPTIPSVSANPATTTATLTGIEIDGTAYAVQSGSANVQSDWNETDTTADDYIKNKPTNVSSFTNDAGYVTTDHTYNFFGTNFHSGNGSSEEHNCNNMTENGLYYYTSNGPSSLGEQSTDGAVMVMAHSASWLTQLAQDYRTGKIYVRSKKNGTWQSWIRVDYADGMRYTGTANTCFTVYQGDGSFMGRSGWASYLICNHGDGATYYSQTIAFPFWGVPIYRRLEGGTDRGWKEFITAENISTQSVNYANSAGAVTQTGTATVSTNNKWFRVLYSGTNDNTTRTETTRKGGFEFNPWRRAIAFVNTNSYLLSCETNKSLIMMVDGDTNHGLCHRAVNGDDNQWGLMPYKDGWLGLGHSSYRWGQIYSTSGSISTSDRNEKKDISPLDDKAKDFIMALNPVSYKFIDGKTGRTHYGMVAQDVEEEMSSLGMTDMDFAGFCKDQKMEEHYIENEDGTKTPDFKYIDEYRYGLRYEEFIAPLIKTVQIQQEEIEMLKKRLEALEGEK